MANQLKMATIQAILSLRARRWSLRRIVRELGVHRETVARYVRAKAPVGNETGRDTPKAAEAPLGADGQANTGSGSRSPACVQIVTLIEIFLQGSLRIEPRSEVVELTAYLLRPATGCVGEKWKIGIWLGGLRPLAGDFPRTYLCHGGWTYVV